MSLKYCGMTIDEGTRLRRRRRLGFENFDGDDATIYHARYYYLCVREHWMCFPRCSKVNRRAGRLR